VLLRGGSPQGPGRGVVPGLGERVILLSPVRREAVVCWIREGVPHGPAGRTPPQPGLEPGRITPLPTPWLEGLDGLHVPVRQEESPPFRWQVSSHTGTFSAGSPLLLEHPGGGLPSCGLQSPAPCAHAHGNGNSGEFGERIENGRGTAEGTAEGGVRDVHSRSGRNATVARTSAGGRAGPEPRAEGRLGFRPGRHSDG